MLIIAFLLRQATYITLFFDLISTLLYLSAFEMIISETFGEATLVEV
jgi:hypothetical protein